MFKACSLCPGLSKLCTCRARKTLGGILVFVVLVVAAKEFYYDLYIRQPDASLNPDPNHTHADFIIWIEDKGLLSFSDDKYMSGTSYSEESHDEVHEYLHKYLHLHDNVSHVVHMHKPGLDMAEFFESLGLIMTSDCFTLDSGDEFCNEGDLRWRMFVNGVERPLDPGYIFNDLDKILYTYGADEDRIEYLIKKHPDDACRYSQACPWRGPAPEENCIADPAVPCVADLEDDFS